MEKWQRALAAGVSGGASVYGEQQKAIRVNKADQAKKDMEYDRKENFARFGKQLNREEQVIGQTGLGISVYAGDALKPDYKETEGFRSTEAMAEEKLDSGMYYQGKKLTNKEYNALDPKAREEAQTSAEYAEWKAGLTKREYRTAGDSKLEHINRMVKEGKMTPEEGIQAEKRLAGVAPKVKGYATEMKAFDKALTAVGYGDLGQEEGDAALVAAHKKASATNAKYGNELAKNPVVAKALSKDMIGKELVALANSDFEGDIEKAGAELLKRKGGGELAASKIQAATSYVNTNYSPTTADKGKWWNPFDTTKKLEKK